MINKSRGFTFVELIVVISIIAILTTLSFPYYNRIKSSLALERSASLLAQDIRRAQEMAISGQELPGGTFPEGGYGIYFSRTADNASYYIFSDKDNNRLRANSGLEDEEQFFLEDNVRVSGLTNSENAIDIVFLPPNPVVFFSSHAGGGDLGATADITVSLITDPSKSRIIRINKAGLVWIE